MPTFAELQTAGARIGEIRVITGDIFDLNDPRENNWFFRLANKLHFNTRPDVIRRALLFESGVLLLSAIGVFFKRRGECGQPCREGAERRESSLIGSIHCIALR